MQLWMVAPPRNIGGKSRMRPAEAPTASGGSKKEEKCQPPPQRCQVAALFQT
jgi:hypothetical protein